MNNEKRNAYFSVVTLAFINSGIFGIIYLRSGYYNVIQNAIGLSHVQMGNIWSIYGVIAAVSYLFGGILADKYNGKKLMIISAIGIMIAGGIFGLLPPYEILILVYAMFAFFAIFTYYPTSVKIVSELGNIIGHGKVFGLYWALIHGSNIFASMVGIRIVSYFSNNNTIVIRSVVIIYEIMIVLSLLLFVKFFKFESTESKNKETINMKETISVLKDSRIRMISIIVFLNYLVVSSFSYFTPYFRDILGLSQERVLLINAIKGDMLGAVITLSIGILVDKLGSAVKLIGIASFVGAFLLFIFVGSSALNVSWIMCVGIIIFITLVVMGAKNVTMVCISEVKIPPKISGRAVGLISFVGYLPDAFYYLVAGRLIQRNGKRGYEILFLISGLIALVCCLSCYILRKKERRREKYD